MKLFTIFFVLASGTALHLRLPHLPTPRVFTNTKINTPRPAGGAAAAALAALLLTQTTNAMPGMAADSQRVGSIPASGFIFKARLGERTRLQTRARLLAGTEANSTRVFFFAWN